MSRDLLSERLALYPMWIYVKDRLSVPPAARLRVVVPVIQLRSWYLIRDEARYGVLPVPVHERSSVCWPGNTDCIHSRYFSHEPHFEPGTALPDRQALFSWPQIPNYWILTLSHAGDQGATDYDWGVVHPEILRLTLPCSSFRKPDSLSSAQHRSIPMRLAFEVMSIGTLDRV
ncbi:hypothetical protein An15g03790 [Aspergillus niger]|uniref:Uncharacterized protein n=2 Tax=Aspergillus niger TaxID=5061 RepID=A5ABX7_ASPNC|nr:hypothetical protein An15g03790 [Aspergillus niger]CAK97249.1 hypothetical protein An15g03790 [Aspergillus niger]